jgi:hypothetical protein
LLPVRAFLFTAMIQLLSGRLRPIIVFKTDFPSVSLFISHPPHPVKPANTLCQQFKLSRIHAKIWTKRGSL